ncbi:MAG: glycoside hydrolase family 2 TIM barrel-domain containing protein [Bryobacteraceae bacterium]|jgi:beta-galactosidase
MRSILTLAFTFSCFLLGPVASAANGPQLPGGILSLNQGWRFYRVDAPVAQEAFRSPAFVDTHWERVNAPHAVRLEPENASGMRSFQGVCWYRRHFTADESWRGKEIFVEFEAAMQVADVWFNGNHVLTHYGGYLPFTVDLTDAVRFSKADNVIALRLDNSDNPDVPPGKPQSQLDFTYMGGLYRNVWLYITDKLHVTDAVYANKTADGGIFVTYPQVSAETATVDVKVEVKNEYASARNCTVRNTLLDSQQRQVAQFSRTAVVKPGADETVAGSVEVRNPQLWHPYHPNLYALVTAVYDGDRLADKRTTRVGIRTIRFDANGFFINGERLIATGVNRHQDYVYVGNALPDSGQYRDIKKLREAGAVSLRCHYPFSPALMDAADELGMLVIVSNPGWQWFKSGPFVERAYQGARDMVRRDRNHPSVVLWEPILNETRYTKEFAETVYQIVHQEYPGDQCYAACDSYGAGAALYDVLYAKKPTSGKPVWVREWGDHVDSFDVHLQNGLARVRRDWGEPAMLRQVQIHRREMEEQYGIAGISGFGLWAGIDAQRGYHHNPFYGGFLDMFRLPKFDYYLFASQRPPDVHVPGLDDGPMVFIATYWMPGAPADVTVFSNCEQVRLSQDGKLIGVKEPDKPSKLPHPPFTFPGLTYSMGRYEQSAAFGNGQRPTRTWVPGELKAEGLIGGKVVATHVVRTAGAAYQLTLTVDEAGRSLVADGSDFVPVRAYLRDVRGEVVPLADDEVRFSVTGEGAMIGDASIFANPMRAEAGIATALIRSTLRVGAIIVTAESFGLKPATATFQSQPFQIPIAAGAR